MIEWCNDQGGINGRTVEGNYYDAKITRSTNVMTEACTQVFMLVGEGWALDGGAEADPRELRAPGRARLRRERDVANGTAQSSRCRTRWTTPRPAAPTCWPRSSPSRSRRPPSSTATSPPTSR